MIEKDGLPRVGPSATKLGVRKDKDIETDDDGNVHRPNFQHGHKNGMSCSPSIAHLPAFALPVEWGGGNERTRVWRIRPDALGPDLVAEQDGATHISIGPSRTMTLDEFTRAIESTAPQWELVVAPESGTDDTQI